MSLIYLSTLSYLSKRFLQKINFFKWDFLIINCIKVLPKRLNYYKKRIYIYIYIYSFIIIIYYNYIYHFIIIISVLYLLLADNPRSNQKEIIQIISCVKKLHYDGI